MCSGCSFDTQLVNMRLFHLDCIYGFNTDVDQISNPFMSVSQSRRQTKLMLIDFRCKAVHI